MTLLLRTFVCRNAGCGGGWWGPQEREVCPRCARRLTELTPTHVTPLR